MKLILLGAPGAGKGTQGEILCTKLGIPTISTGNILRAAIKDESPLGLEVKSFMDSGTLVPDDLVMEILAQRLAQPDCEQGFILDGVPRTLVQADALDQSGVTFDYVLSLEISDEEIEQRMVGRRVCRGCGAPYHIQAKPPKTEGVCDICGQLLMQRSDDMPETVRSRLKIYHDQTEPLKAYYQAKGNLVSVNNQPTIQATSQVILEAMKLS